MFLSVGLLSSLLLAFGPFVDSASSSTDKTRHPLYVGVLLPVASNPRGYAPQVLKALQLAVDHINAHSSILPDHELVIKFKDTKCNPGLGIYQLYKLLETRNESIVALLGAACSIVTQPLAETSYLWNIPQINFMSQSPTLLNRDRYPRYYPIIPTINGLNAARVSMMQSQGWSHCVILSESADLFNQNANNLSNVMSEIGLDRPEIINLPDDDNSNDFSDAVARIQASDIRILFGLFYARLGRKTICKLYLAGIKAPAYVWIFNDVFSSDDWYLGGDYGCTDQQIEDAVNGHLAIRFGGLRPNTEQITLTGRTVFEVAEEFRARRNLSLNTAALEAFNLHSSYGYDAAMAVGLLFHRLAEKLTETGEIERLNKFTYDDEALANTIHDTLVGQNFSFEGLTGVVEFYHLFGRSQHQREADAHVEIRYRWSNKSVLVARYSNAKQNLTTVAPIQWTTPDGLAPVDVPPHTLLYASKGIFIAIVTIASVFIVLSLLLLHLIIRHRKHWLMQRSIPRLNQLIVLGCVSFYISVIFNGFDGQFYKFSSSSLTCCYWRTILLIVGFTLSFGSVLVKTIFTLLRQLLRVRIVSFLFLSGVLILGILLLIDSLLMIAWFSVNPWEKGEYIVKSEEISRFIFVTEHCKTEDFWGYIIVIYKITVLVACILLTVIRMRVVGKSESSHPDPPRADLIVFCTGLGLLVAGVGFAFVDDPGVRYALTSVTVIALATVILALLLGRKVYLVVTGKAEQKKIPSNYSLSDLSELERKELQELRAKSIEQKNLLVKFVLERASSVRGPLANDVQRVLGYLPGETTSSVRTNVSFQSSGSTMRLTSSAPQESSV